MKMMNSTCGFAWLNDIQLLSLKVHSLLSYFQRTVIIYCYTSSTLTTVKSIQVSFL